MPLPGLTKVRDPQPVMWMGAGAAATAAGRTPGSMADLRHIGRQGSHQTLRRAQRHCGHTPGKKRETGKPRREGDTVYAFNNLQCKDVKSLALGKFRNMPSVQQQHAGLRFVPHIHAAAAPARAAQGGLQEPQPFFRTRAPSLGVRLGEHVCPRTQISLRRGCADVGACRPSHKLQRAATPKSVSSPRVIIEQRITRSN